MDEPDDDSDVTIYAPADEAPSIPGLDSRDDRDDVLDKTGVLRLFEDIRKD